MSSTSAADLRLTVVERESVCVLHDLRYVLPDLRRAKIVGCPLIRGPDRRELPVLSKVDDTHRSCFSFSSMSSQPVRFRIWSSHHFVVNTAEENKVLRLVENCPTGNAGSCRGPCPLRETM